MTAPSREIDSRYTRSFGCRTRSASVGESPRKCVNSTRPLMPCETIATLRTGHSREPFGQRRDPLPACPAGFRPRAAGDGTDRATRAAHSSGNCVGDLVDRQSLPRAAMALHQPLVVRHRNVATLRESAPRFRAFGPAATRSCVQRLRARAAAPLHARVRTPLLGQRANPSVPASAAADSTRSRRGARDTSTSMSVSWRLLWRR